MISNFQSHVIVNDLGWGDRILANFALSGIATLRSCTYRVNMEKTNKVCKKSTIDQGKGEPWKVHHVILYCSVDHRLWTAEGTKQVRTEKAVEIANVLTKMKEKGDLNEKQQAFIKRKNSTLARINSPFNRPSKPLYKGQSDILVGVSLGLDKPATVAVVDARTQQVLTYRSIRQLLGENYQLLNRQRREQQSLSHSRHKAQKRFAPNEFGASELGEYIDRLLAKEIVAIALSYQAESIVLPKLGDMREIIQSEIQAIAEQKCPGYVEAQQKYAKQYRVSIHQWSYGRLIQSIQSQAIKANLCIEEGKQPLQGSPQEKAKGCILHRNYKIKSAKMGVD